MLTEFQKRKIANLFAIHDLNQDGALERSDYVEYVTRISAESGLGPGSAKYENFCPAFLGSGKCCARSPIAIKTTA